jgi:hypothetical protein
MTPTVACVVDASVGTKLCLAEDLSHRADALVAQRAADPLEQFAEPDLADIECADILMMPAMSR